MEKYSIQMCKKKLWNEREKYVIISIYMEYGKCVPCAWNDLNENRLELFRLNSQFYKSKAIKNFKFNHKSAASEDEFLLNITSNHK